MVADFLEKREIMNREEIFASAPCLKEGPLAEAGLNFIETALKMDGGNYSGVLKTWATHYLFVSVEAAFKASIDPTPAILAALNHLTNLFAAAEQLDTRFLGAVDASHAALDTIEAKEAETGDHYGNLFKAFDDEHYFEEAASLLRTRLERNGIDLAQVRNWDVLDAGCGGGRYSAAWAKLGAKSVTGVDFSEIGIQTARERTSSGFPNVKFELGDALAIPFPDNSYDCSFSNGVLHHTRDWKKGIHEIMRVLKPGGFGWLYLIENPGGYFWDIIEILRVLMEPIDKSLARVSLRILGIPTNRIFYILDHIMVPINIRLTEQEIEACLAEAGAKEIRKLRRGTDFDRIEQIYQKVPYAGMKYGVGEQRYVFTK
jgi:ubiquinone/menaquinone biosynthesis C-methylase UbiE